MPSSSPSWRRVLTSVEREKIDWARMICTAAGYPRAADILERVLARDAAERAPRIVLPAWRWLDGK